MKLQIKNGYKIAKFKNTQRESTTQLNNQWVKEEIKREKIRQTKMET